jgi:hypothetical protein
MLIDVILVRILEVVLLGLLQFYFDDTLIPRPFDIDLLRAFDSVSSIAWLINFSACK